MAAHDGSPDHVNAKQWTDVKVRVDVDGTHVSNIPTGRDVMLAKVILEIIQP